MGVRTIACLMALCVAAAVATTVSGAPQLGQALPERQLPVFRTDSHFVRVDAYPTEKDGSITRGLAAEDFEVTEDGKPQRLDSAEYIEYERWSPGIDPPSVETQRESYRLAADPRYRVVVVYVNRLSRSSARHIQQPLVDMLTREVGPRDLYGLLMPNHEASDLVLGKFTPAEQARLSRFLGILDHSSPFEMDPIEQKLFSCFGMGSVQRWRLDNLYRDLEGIIAILGTLRDERKSLVFVSDSMPGVGGQRGGGGNSSRSSMPQGQPPISRPMPGATGLSLGTYNPTQGVDTCELLARDMPFQNPDRYDDLIRLARRMNVAIHPVSPMGLTASSSVFSGSALRRLADETGGIAVVNVNDIDAGLKKIVNDMPAYYLLGYHTSNTKWDGRRREIKVRLKSTGKTIRARREYLAPSAADMAAIRAAADAPPRPAGPTPIERALGGLARLRDDAEVHVQGAVREGALAVAVEVPSGTATSGGWYEGADVEVFATSEGSPSTAAGPALAGMTGATKMRTGSRGAEIRLPIAAGDAGPWQVRVLVKRGDETLEDRARVVLDPATAFGEPLLYRAASPPAAPYVPVADRQFQRNERMRVEWLVSSPTPIRLKARLLQTTGNPLTYAPPVVSEERGGATLARVDMTMTSIAAGDYIIELTAESNGQEQTTLLAIRVLR
ncbi:MAG: VWA domain-containing protein [Acidobacteria bacterium]|nr:VWA domain-containing protein [Acidobacteriota bacterium]